jgi:thiol:disulfide interchange protein
MTFVKNTLITIVFFSLATLQNNACAQSQETGQPHAIFRDIGLTEAIQIASAEKKNLLLYFMAGWSARCKTMERSVFSEDTIQRVLLDTFIVLRIDVDTHTGQQLEYQFKIGKYPTMLIIDPKQKILKRKNGGLRQKEFLKFIM